MIMCTMTVIVCLIDSRSPSISIFHNYFILFALNYYFGDFEENLINASLENMSGKGSFFLLTKNRWELKREKHIIRIDFDRRIKVEEKTVLFYLSLNNDKKEIQRNIHTTSGTTTIRQKTHTTAHNNDWFGVSMAVFNIADVMSATVSVRI